MASTNKGKDARKMFRKLEDFGCELRLTKKGHTNIYLHGQYITTTSGGSPSDRRSILNFRSALKRNGIVL